MAIAYDSMYRGTSGYASHATLGALQQLLGEREGDEVNIVFGGHLTGIPHSLTNVLLGTVDSIDSVVKIFRLELPLEGVRWAHELKAIANDEPDKTPFKFDIEKHFT